MIWDLTEATQYISAHTLDNEDFLEADDMRKTALLNVSLTELTRRFKQYVIPVNAVYLFANALAVAYNDTNRFQQQGIASFSVKGMSTTFKDWAKTGTDSLITPEIYDLIGVENGVKLSRLRVARSVR